MTTISFALIDEKNENSISDYDLKTIFDYLKDHPEIYVYKVDDYSDRDDKDDYVIYTMYAKSR